MSDRTRLPLSSYRLQFNSHFRFSDALAVVDYLHRLGISDCYASSYLKAVPGSPHGYDIADPTRLNPEIGTGEEYWAWIAAMQQRGMGHILDVVPNHMGIAKSANPWWLDVLENGPSSRFAGFFDIEWRPVKDELADKVLIPILGDQYGDVLERQELQVAYQEGAFVVRYYDDVLPIAVDTFEIIFAPELEGWVRDQGESAAANELLSILTASRNLPPRSSRDAEAIAVRAREKDVVKRRLAVLVDGSDDVRALVTRAIQRFNGEVGQPRSFDRLDDLLTRQSYRLAHWRVASEEINYRRFFDVNQLAALRMEDPVVFDEVHRFIFELVERGAATGLRIDHVDGLYAPREYLRRLHGRGPAPLYVVVEKILGADEQLPADWPVHGTTGYEFAAVVNNLFVDGRNEQALDDIYARLVPDRRQRLTFPDLCRRSKKQILHETMSGDINSLAHRLSRFAERHRHFRDFTLYSLISTIKEIIACFPVYRTYVTASEPVSDHDRLYIAQAVRCARGNAPGLTSFVLDFVERMLLKQTPVTSQDDCDEQAAFIGKFQQITGPVAAKGVEDTALYAYNRLLSLNEVGSDPTVFGMEPSQVHAWLAERQRRWPAALSATSTHDTKRGEDVRARLNVLSEIPGAWRAAVAKWRTLNRRFKTEVRGVLAPDSNEEYLLYQTLVGAWPFDPDAATADAFHERLREYIVKALRESKVHTSWVSPNECYERAVLRFVDALLDRRRPNPFLHAFDQLHTRVAEFGIYNSLAQLLVKITAPGVPDFYQGTELWDLALVDPDNRRVVDYEHRRGILDTLAPCTRAAAVDVDELLAGRADGRVKLFSMHRALRARATMRDAFEQGAYVPLQTAGAHKDQVFAFAREAGDDVAVTCVPRFVASLVPDGGPPIGASVWGDTRIALPPSLSSRCLSDAFTGATVQPHPHDGVPSVAAAAAFSRFPIALLTTRTGT